jgi:hypothetical protein
MQAAAMFPEIKSFRESYANCYSPLLDLPQLTLFSIIDEMKRLIAKYQDGYEGYEKTIALVQ